jgi:hypothetical protein
MKDNKIIREDFKTPEAVIYERDVEIKKLLEDKIKLLEKIVSIYETRPYFAEAEDIMKKYLQEVK